MFQDVLDSALRRRHEAEQAERGSDAGEWHPSSLTGCERAAVYSYTGTPVSNETTPRSMAVLQRGTDVHNIIQAELIRQTLERGGSPQDYLTEVKVDYMGVKGSCDALMVMADGFKDEPGPELERVYELHEYKSIKSLHFVKNSPKPEHVMQACIYAWGLMHTGYLISEIRIVYVERETFKVIEHIILPWDEAAEAAFEDTLDNLNAHVAEGTLPDRMPDDYWLCRYCDWRTLCKGVE
jgi:CRISPR/Cas system-associated exonuclease Cas4 (RecB family)